jgi:transcriptional regulator with XRE-family HTH domain
MEQMESGRRRAGAGDLYRICRALDIDIITLFRDRPALVAARGLADPDGGAKT